jgi:hypothetical protein
MDDADRNPFPVPTPSSSRTPFGAAERSRSTSPRSKAEAASLELLVVGSHVAERLANSIVYDDGRRALDVSALLHAADEEHFPLQSEPDWLSFVAHRPPPADVSQWLYEWMTDASFRLGVTADITLRTHVLIKRFARAYGESAELGLCARTLRLAWLACACLVLRNASQESQEPEAIVASRLVMHSPLIPNPAGLEAMIIAEDLRNQLSILQAEVASVLLADQAGEGLRIERHHLDAAWRCVAAAAVLRASTCASPKSRRRSWSSRRTVSSSSPLSMRSDETSERAGAHPTRHRRLSNS